MDIPVNRSGVVFAITQQPDWQLFRSGSDSGVAVIPEWQ
jgi:hypothetical protein